MMPGMGAIIAAGSILSILQSVLVLSILLTVIVVGKYFYIRYLAKKHGVPFKVLLGKRLHRSWIVLSVSYGVMGLLVAVVLIGNMLQGLEKPKGVSLSKFVITEDHRYGDVIFPEGSVIYREFPRNQDDFPLEPNLAGLKSAKFPKPIELVGLQVSALERYPLRLELAEDAMISPVYELQYEAESHKMIWVKNPMGKKVECQKGDVALFVDLSRDMQNLRDDIEYGENAHFFPKEWKFVKCETNYVIKVPDPLKRTPMQYSYPLKTINPLNDEAISALTHYYTALDSKDDEALSHAIDALQALADDGQADVRYIIDQIKNYRK